MMKKTTITKNNYIHTTTTTTFVLLYNCILYCILYHTTTSIFYKISFLFVCVFEKQIHEKSLTYLYREQRSKVNKGPVFEII